MTFGKLATTWLLLLSPCLLIAQEAEKRTLETPEEEELEEVAANLSRWFGGAGILLPNLGRDGTGTDDNGYTLISPENQDEYAESRLLSADSTETYEVEPGTTRIVVDLGDFRFINKINFIATGGSGTFEASTSNKLRPLDSDKWKPAVKPSTFTPDAFITNLEFRTREARYVALTFQSEQPVSISGFGIFGLVSANDLVFNFEESRAEEVDRGIGDTVSFDFASLAAGSDVGIVYQEPVGAKAEKHPVDRFSDEEKLANEKNQMVIYQAGNPRITKSEASSLATPTPREFRNILDDDIDTFLGMPFGSPEQVIVIDAKTSTQINTISSILQVPNGRLEFYFVGNLPEELAATLDSVEGTVNEPVDDEYFSNTPLALYREIEEPGYYLIRGAVENLPGRYLILRWLPASTDSTPLIVFEISMLSEILPEYVNYSSADDEIALGSAGISVDFQPPPTSP